MTPSANKVDLLCVLVALAVVLAPPNTYGAAPAAAPTPTAPTPVPSKVVRYAQRLLKKYDTNGDGHLQPSEFSRMRGQPKAADRDADGTITADELLDHVARFGQHRQLRLLQHPAAGEQALPSLLRPVTESASGAAASSAKFFIRAESLPPGLPSWFTGRDGDGDGQITMAEFAPKPGQSDLQEFARYDLNRDGVITAEEYLRTTKPPEKKPPKPVEKAKVAPAVKTPAEPAEKDRPRAIDQEAAAAENKDAAAPTGDNPDSADPRRRRSRSESEPRNE